MLPWIKQFLTWGFFWLFRLSPSLSTFDRLLAPVRSQPNAGHRPLRKYSQRILQALLRHSLRRLAKYPE